jgi:hypothetical protein
MTRKTFGCLLGLFCLLAVPVAADWVPEDGHKMHFPQYPNEYGWNVHITAGELIADDWRCTASGGVTDIHFWGSWYEGIPGTINGFWITIYEDIPDPDPSDPATHSQPGAILWESELITDFTEIQITPDPVALEGWYDPFNDFNVPYDHESFYQYNITGIPDPFIQTQGEIYWLAIVPDVEQAERAWGWKSSYLHWNDDAVAYITGWTELFEPDLDFVSNAFHVEVDEGGTVVTGGGQRAWNNTWYFYEDDEPGWWNIWFYDHPFAEDRWKEIFVDGSIRTLVAGVPGYAEIAVNWSTPAWSQYGNPPGVPRRPPLPEDVASPMIPGSFLDRYIIWQGPVTAIPADLGELGHDIPDFNPEWVSIDIRGENFVLDGLINHACVGDGPQSLDLSFVINGPIAPTTGACCWPDGNCTVETQADCEDATIIDGTYMGDGSVCLGDGDGNDVDDLCEGADMLGACCQSDGTCYRTSQAACLAASHEYKGHGSACVGDPDGDGYDNTCDAPPGACCLPNGSCVSVDAATCFGQNGDYLGDGTVCLGDGNTNGVDDACEEADELKWFQPPDLDVDGMDVNATYHTVNDPYVLATDFECTSTGPITRIHIFGSWYLDKLPYDDPANVSFNLSLHEDIPDPDGTGPLYSMPGAQVCFMEDVPFDVQVYAADLEEGWFDPPDNYTMFPLGDRVCWEYIFYLDGSCVQTGTSQVPVVYWVDVQAYPDDPAAFFGWKSTREEWNDDAVWAIGEDGQGASPNWNELRRPDEGYLYDPGDVDHNGIIDLFDVIYMGDWVTNMGPPPPYSIPGTNPPFYPAADVSGDCLAGGTADLQHLYAWVVASMFPPSYCSAYPPGIVQGASIDLALAIYGPSTSPSQEGACCYDDGNCTDGMTESDCTQSGGTYGGDDSSCGGDNDGNGVPDGCEAVLPMGACCYGNAISPLCIYTTQTLCESAGAYNGTWYAGENCGTFTCPPAGACCYEDVAAGWTCIITDDAATCEALPNGVWYEGADCASIECPPSGGEQRKWFRPPDLAPTGMDVMCTQPNVLADDFLCEVTGPITRIVVYGSWWMDEIPQDPASALFTLSIHEDIPDPDGQGPEYSMPGELLCLYHFDAGTYTAETIALGDITEGWFNPETGDYLMPGDHNCFRYVFDLPDELCVQMGTEAEPMVYWLDVQAEYPGSMYFGWKTTIPPHWNDDAVWALGDDPASLTPWTELVYPPAHEWAGNSIDLAFEIWGYEAEDTCALQMPGDVENDGDIDGNDLTALIDFLGLIGTPPPVPANGDVNGDCRINQHDVDHLASFLATGGPPLVDCTCVLPYPFRDCCIGKVGNVNLDPNELVTIGDISLAIDHLFITNPDLVCLTEADVNQSGGTNPVGGPTGDITIGDISLLIDHLFIAGPDVLILYDCLE